MAENLMFLCAQGLLSYYLVPSVQEVVAHFIQ